MLIHINRKIFNALPEELKDAYISDAIPFEIQEEVGNNIKYIEQSIKSLILRNEKIIEKYGWEKYLKEDYPAYDHCDGFSHITGQYGVMAFDWSADTLDDLDYSFEVFKVL